MTKLLIFLIQNNRPKVQDFLYKHLLPFLDIGYNKIIFPLPMDETWLPLMLKKPSLMVEWINFSTEILYLLDLLFKKNRLEDRCLLILESSHIDLLDLLFTWGCDYSVLTDLVSKPPKKHSMIETPWLCQYPYRQESRISWDDELHLEEPFFVVKTKLRLEEEEEISFLPLIAREIQEILDTAVIFTKDLECLVHAYVSVVELAIKGKSISACFPGLHFFRRDEHFCLPAINLPEQQEKVRNLLIL